MKRRVFQYIGLLGALSLLSSCSVGTYRDVGNNVNTQAAKMANYTRYQSKPAPIVTLSSGYYVNTAPVQFANYPAYLKKSIHFQAKQLPLNLLMNQVFSGSQIVVTYDHTVSPGLPVNLNYTGTIKGALNDLAEETGYSYTLTGNHVTWSAFETKTFNISFMPGTSSYSVGGLNAGTGSASTGSTSNNVSAKLGATQFSDLKGSLSIWKDLAQTLNKLKSPTGQVVVSEASTTVTVHDHPENVAAMTRYINHLNHILSEEVEIKVQVLQLQLNKGYQYGINWNLVDQKIAGLTYSVSGAAGSAASAAESTGLNKASALTKLTVGKGASNAFLNALSEQGKLSVTTQPTVVTLNDQIASIRITQDTGYLKSVNTSVSNGTVTASLQAGMVTDGYTLYVLPKIQKTQVYLQISSSLANLLGMETAKSGGGTSGTVENGSANQIQVPILSNKEFNQRSRVATGETLVIAGFSSVRNQSVSDSPFGITPLGGQGAEHKNVETIVLITPTILPGNT